MKTELFFEIIAARIALRTSLSYNQAQEIVKEAKRVAESSGPVKSKELDNALAALNKPETSSFVKLLAKGFAEWERGVRVTPSFYMNQDEMRATDVSELAQNSAVYFDALLRKIAAGE